MLVIPLKLRIFARNFGTIERGHYLVGIWLRALPASGL